MRILFVGLLIGIGWSSIAEGADSSALALEASLPEVLQDSRRLLVGTRSLGKASCIRTIARKGMVTRLNHGDTNACLIRLTSDKGGAGLLYTHQTLNREVSGPAEDFRWHQEVFLPWLGEREEMNTPILARVNVLLHQVGQLRREVENDWKEGLEIPAGDSWPEQCLRFAMEAEEGEQRDRWLKELEGGLFALADLHRWYGRLLRNTRQALAFQSLSAPLFQEMDPMYGGKYQPRIHIGRFPVGNLSLYGADNFLEVERQAEGLFRPPADWKEAAEVAMTLNPDVRELYAEILEDLKGSPTKVLWEKAVRTPYERSFVQNQLWRAQAAGFDGELHRLILRYAARHGEEASLEGLLDVLPYRAGAPFSGLEWGDRYTPALWPEGESPPTAFAVLKEAHEEAHDVYTKYTGLVLTLRKAMETGQMDCIRMTDAMGAWVRNRGQPGFRVVRMSRGLRAGRVSGMGHTVAGIVEAEEPLKGMRTLDGLIAGGGLKRYPQGFRQGGTFAVDIYGRGLDGYLWLEGTVFEGPHAGERRVAEFKDSAGGPEGDPLNSNFLHFPLVQRSGKGYVLPESE